MSLTLKTYQTNALAALESFFAKARGTRSEDETARAFKAARDEALGDSAPKALYRRFCRVRRPTFSSGPAPSRRALARTSPLP